MRLLSTLPALVLALSALATAASASVFDNATDATEAANAMVHCSTELPSLLFNGSAYVSKVTAKQTNVSSQVSTKRYTIESASGGGFERPSKGPTLTIDLTITQPPVGLEDAPARSEWRCTLQK